MKKFFTTIFFVFSFSCLLIAQPKLGLKLGGNIANLSGDDIENVDSKFGAAFGAFFMYQFGLFAIQPEVYYTMKGACDSENIFGTTVETSLNLNYFEVPLLFKVIIPVQGAGVHPAVFAGPFVGFNSSATIKVEANGESEEEDIEDVKSTEFGLQFGAGLGVDVGKNEVGVDIRYILGLSSLDDSDAELDITNGVFNFNIYFAFSLL